MTPQESFQQRKKAIDERVPEAYPIDKLYFHMALEIEMLYEHIQELRNELNAQANS